MKIDEERKSSSKKTTDKKDRYERKSGKKPVEERERKRWVGGGKERLSYKDTGSGDTIVRGMKKVRI